MFAARSSRFSPIAAFSRVAVCLSLAMLLGVFWIAAAPAVVIADDGEPTTWILVRHAEREGSADALSAEGKQRAKLLGQLASALRVSAIYSTPYARTRATVAPAAEATGVTVNDYAASESEWGWVQQAASDHAGGVILVVGHSNTTDKLAGFLSGREVAPIGHNQYDRLWLIQTGDDWATMVETQYGVASEDNGGGQAMHLVANIDVGAKPVEGAKMLLDGSRQMLDENWTYWEGPRFSSSLPIKWKVVEDPVDGGQAVMTFDPAAAGGKYGAADIVTKEAFRDFRLHVELLIKAAGGNSGVYLQNRYEIQVLDGDKTTHGMAAVINEKAAPYEVYRGVGKWNAYDIVFRAARFDGEKRTEKALVTMYFNGQKVHQNVAITRVWGGPNSGMDGDNDEQGNGITDRPGGLKLQAEGHEVLYRNIWIKPLELEKADTDILK